MNNINTISNFISQSDTSLNYIHEETGNVINIYKTIEGSYELSNEIGTLFISSCSDSDELLSIIDYMSNAETILNISKYNKISDM